MSRFTPDQMADLFIMYTGDGLTPEQAMARITKLNRLNMTEAEGGQAEQEAIAALWDKDVAPLLRRRYGGPFHE